MSALHPTIQTLHECLLYHQELAAAAHDLMEGMKPSLYDSEATKTAKAAMHTKHADTWSKHTGFANALDSVLFTTAPLPESLAFKTLP